MNGEYEAGPSNPERSREGRGEGQSKRRPSKHSEESLSKQADSIAKNTRIPTSLQQTTPQTTIGLRPPKSLGKIKNKKLRAHLASTHLAQVRAAEHAKTVDEYLYAPAPGEGAGMIEAEDDLERTARVTQSEIRSNIAVDAARKSFSLDLSGGKKSTGMGPYRCSYTRNGRHLLLGGRKGHLAASDWQTGKLMCEINVRETVRDVTWLHNHSFFAAAQKKYTYIYDNQGAEVHRLKNHTDVHRLEFLPYHFLLATIGAAGYLKYQDTSTGELIAEHKTGLGLCSTMAQNPLTAVIHLGHSNGTVSLWTPNLSSPALKMLAHRGPISGLSVSAKSGGREIATSSLDGSVKVWDSRMLGKGPVREWVSRRPASDIKYSQRGLLGMAWGNHVSLYDTQKKLGNAPPGPYLVNGFPGCEPVQINFCPFEDVLGVAHTKGFDSLVIPGAGEPRFDSSEADPYERRKSRREREVRSLLDKVQPDTISLDTEFLGQIDMPSAAEHPLEGSPERNLDQGRGIAKVADGTPFARLSRMDRLRLEGKADEGPNAGVSLSQENDLGDSSDEDDGKKHIRSEGWTTAAKPGTGLKKEKKKMRGKNGAMKRYLKKKKENVIDPRTEAIREKLERLEKEQKEAGQEGAMHEEGASALDMFQRKRKRHA